MILSMAKAKTKMSASERVSVGTFPTGISYADRSVEVAGDYKRLAFLPFDTLVLEWSAKRVSPDVREYIERDAAKLQAKRGQSHRVSSAGQTVALGGAGGKSKAELEREIKGAVIGGVGSGDAGYVGDFEIQVGDLDYRVVVRPDPHRGGYGAKLVSPGVGVIMDENGRSPSDALTRLTRSLRAGDDVDRRIAREISKRTDGR